MYMPESHFFTREFGSQGYTLSPDRIRSLMCSVSRKMLSAAACCTTERLNGTELEALTRSGCMYLTAVPEDAEMVKTVEQAWQECIATKNISDEEKIRFLLAMYHIAYGPTTPPSDTERAVMCDSAAYSLLDRQAILRNSNCTELIMTAAVELFKYADPDDMKGDAIPEFFIRTAGSWKEELSDSIHSGHPHEEMVMMRLAVLEAGADVFGTWHADKLPEAKDLTSIESLKPLSYILSLRGNDPRALQDVCTALGLYIERSSDPTNTITASASLLEALCTLYFIAEEENVERGSR